MPIISQIGRKDPRVRTLIASIYLLLVLGAVTMLYPFLVMLSGSTKSQVDTPDLDPFPAFLTDDLSLYRKHLEGLFNERLVKMKIAYDMDVISFGHAEPPDTLHASLIAEWQAFLEQAQLPDTTYFIGYMHTPLSLTLPSGLRAFKKEMIERYDNDIGAANQALGTEFVNWNAFEVLPEFYLARRSKVLTSPLYDEVRRFKASQPKGHRYYFMVEGFYKTQFIKTQYTRSIEEYNRQHGTRYASYDEVFLSRTVPDGTEQEKADWENFVRTSLSLLWVRVDPSAAPTYRRFLKAKYGSLEALNRNYGTSYTSFRKVPLIDEPPQEGMQLTDWDAFISGWKDPETGRLYAPAAEQLRIHSIDFMFRDYLSEKLGGLAALNQALGTDYRSIAEVKPPQRELHYLAFLESRGRLRREFVCRNYIKVIDFMVLHGRGVVNTLIYCSLAVLAALLVNPLAAYALSRYRLANGYKLLLFMLLVMAFPPMVTQIPVFLMLRDFKLLNTFAALVLPGIAHGYSIFLLKGFFDSLPRELYENAQLDGAGEWTMFWHITMSLSKPILAVIALHAFTIAYSNFMFALLICQDERMWTLMVWLYQLQQRSGQGVVYASLIIAAIPTFLIFVFCQKIIMRGIVVPVEK